MQTQTKMSQSNHMDDILGEQAYLNHKVECTHFWKSVWARIQQADNHKQMWCRSGLSGRMKHLSTTVQAPVGADSNGWVNGVGV